MNRRTLVPVLVFVAVLFSQCTLPADAAPAHVLVTLPAGAELPSGFADQLAAWRQSGAVSSAVLVACFVLEC